MPSMPPRHPESEAPAREAIQRYIDAVNANDPNAYETLNFPHVRIQAGLDWILWERPARRDSAVVKKATPDWHRSVLEEATVIHSSPDKVHFNAVFTRRDAKDRPVHRLDMIYVVTNQNGRWGIQMASSFPVAPA